MLKLMQKQLKHHGSEHTGTSKTLNFYILFYQLLKYVWSEMLNQ